MAKVADRYFKVDSWNITEAGFDPLHGMVAESVFSLGNEYMGVRGYFDEHYSGSSLRGAYFNGVYEEEHAEFPSAYKGIVGKTHFMVNAVDWLDTRITVNEEQLDLWTAQISDFHRNLNLRSGVLERSFLWKLSEGISLHLTFTRFLDMEESERGYQAIKICRIVDSGCTASVPCEVSMEMGINFDIPHMGRGKRYWKQLRSGHIQSGESEVESGGTRPGVAVMGATLNTGQRIFSGFMWDTDFHILPEPIFMENYAALRFDFTLGEGETHHFVKSIVNLVERDQERSDDAIWNDGLCRLIKESVSYIEAELRRDRYWKNFWDRSDITIKGDDENQQGIRFCLFQLQQCYHGRYEGDNIGAKGLTGESYNGHAFWDTETYCLPFYLFSDPPAARKLLEFRYACLDKAKERAIQLDCQGACFPVATLNGEEACDLWQHASLQFQSSTAVAYGIAHYSDVTGDTNFLYAHGAELLVEISRFLVSRGSWNAEGTAFGFYGVMGPDEFHLMVNNNSYTNYMAKQTFEYTLKTLALMKQDQPRAYTLLIRKTGLLTTELDAFARCAGNMLLLYDEKKGLYEQHEGFFSLPHTDIHSIPVEEFPLYQHWSYDRIYRTDMIKQPDVLMFLFLYNRDFDRKVKEANYEYYEPRTIHESSLSPSIHSIFASEFGRHREAFDFFKFATRMDLDNYNRNTGEGLHITSLAAAWMNIVYGFAGMRSDGGPLSFSPSLPETWESYEFRIRYKGSTIIVAVSAAGVFFRLMDSGIPITIEVYGKDKDLDTKGFAVPLGGFESKGRRN